MTNTQNIIPWHWLLTPKISFLGQVGDLGFANELGNYAEYSGAPNEEEVLQYARVVIDVRTLQLHS